MTSIPSDNGRRKQLIKIAKIGGSWLIALVVALALQRYVFQSYQVYGHSMEPTLAEGDYLVISKLGVSLSDLRNHDYVPGRGDIIVLKSPLDQTRLIKRVIGLPGEQIKVRDGKVTIFNAEHPAGFDPYAELGLESTFTSGTQDDVTVPSDSVYVIGDNRSANGSLDSRDGLGPVPLSDIIGKLVLRLYPFSKIDRF